MKKFHFEFTTDKGEVGNGKIDDVEFRLCFSKNSKGEGMWGLIRKDEKEIMSNKLAKQIYKELNKYHYKEISYLRYHEG
jgi:hypothetical protein|tara:strand:+ start:488 stop:724 length:237 start_codon:yes stop_codon:yes gene_type:complete